MAKITKIIIEVDGKVEDGKLVITLEEAKALKEALDELLEKEVEKEYVPYIVTPYNPWQWGRTYTYYTTEPNAIKVIPMWEGGLRTTTGGGCARVPGSTWTNEWNGR